MSAEGNYAQGKKTGVWKYYHENGRLKQMETNNPEKDDQFEEKFNEMGIINTRVELNASTTGKIIKLQRQWHFELRSQHQRR
jgi:antitoxin component YwqK of YwqJK toxin-antitoxin module